VLLISQVHICIPLVEKGVRVGRIDPAGGGIVLEGQLVVAHNLVDKAPVETNPPVFGEKGDRRIEIIEGLIEIAKLFIGHSPPHVRHGVPGIQVMALVYTSIAR
jgi:hypothetical protein